MNDSEKASFVTAIGAMLETFGQEATKPILHGYWLGLGDLELGDLQAAVAKAIRSCDRLPRPVELRRLAGEKTKDQRAIAAWGDVLRASSLGSYRHIDFQDRVINAVIRNLGGWPKFLERFDSEDGEKWARIDFLKTYVAFVEGGVDGEACKPLPGLSQASLVNGEVVAPVPRRIACAADRAGEPRISQVAKLRKLVLTHAINASDSGQF